MTESQSIYLFVYGTLLDSGVQSLVFGRKPQAIPELLSGYFLVEKYVLDTYPSLIPGAGPEASVTGKVLKITQKELELADRYETSAYFRKVVTLESGVTAWVYLHRQDNQ